MSARSISTLSINVQANTAEASQRLSQLIAKIDGMADKVQKSGASMGAAMGSLFSGGVGLKSLTGGIGGALGGLMGGPQGGMLGAAIGQQAGGQVEAIGEAILKGASLVGQGVKKLVDFGAEYQVAKATFSSLAGSDSAGEAILNDLSKLAAGTIFSSEQLRKSAIMLQGYGVEAKQLVPTLTKLSLIAQQTGRGEEALGRIALNYGQVRSMGKLQGTELREFALAGLQVSEFAKTLGVSQEAFRGLVEEGKVGADVVANTFNRLGSTAEMTAKKVNESYKGQLNQVKDIALLTFEKIGEGIIEKFGLANLMGKVGEAFATLPERAKALYPVLENIKNLIEPVAVGLLTGFQTAAKAGMAFVTAFLPDMKTAQGYADSIGKGLAIGIGSAVDMALTLGKYLSIAALPFAQLADKLLPLITDVKLPSLAQGTINAGASIAAAQAMAGPGGYREMARKDYAANLGALKAPSVNTPKLNSEGISVGPPGLPAAVKELADSINRNGMTGKGNAYSEFMTSMNTLGMAQSTPGLIKNQAGADQFIFDEFKKLTGSLGRLENRLPAAIDRFTVEGQQQIEKVIANMQDRGMEDVPALMRKAEEQRNEQIRATKRLADEVRAWMQNRPTPIVVGG